MVLNAINVKMALLLTQLLVFVKQIASQTAFYWVFYLIVLLIASIVNFLITLPVSQHVKDATLRYLVALNAKMQINVSNAFQDTIFFRIKNNVMFAQTSV